MHLEKPQKYVGESQFAHHWYKPTWLATIGSHCVTCQDACVQ